MRVATQTKVSNEADAGASVTVKTILYDRNGKEAGTTETPLTIPAGKELDVAQEIRVASPALGSPVSPTMYRAVSQVSQRGKLLDEVATPFGIRSLSWSVEQGLLLNGKSAGKPSPAQPLGGSGL